MIRDSFLRVYFSFTLLFVDECAAMDWAIAKSGYILLYHPLYSLYTYHPGIRLIKTLHSVFFILYTIYQAVCTHVLALKNEKEKEKKNGKEKEKVVQLCEDVLQAVAPVRTVSLLRQLSDSVQCLTANSGAGRSKSEI